MKCKQKHQLRRVVTCVYRESCVSLTSAAVFYTFKFDHIKGSVNNTKVNLIKKSGEIGYHTCRGSRI